MSILNTPGSFNSFFMEQALLNHARRTDGPMPWRKFRGKWSCLRPKEEDVATGRASLHEKFWKSPDDGS